MRVLVNDSAANLFLVSSRIRYDQFPLANQEQEKQQHNCTQPLCNKNTPDSSDPDVALIAIPCVWINGSRVDLARISSRSAFAREIVVTK